MLRRNAFLIVLIMSVIGVVLYHPGQLFPGWGFPIASPVPF
jgi:hypothetical protein